MSWLPFEQSMAEEIRSLISTANAILAEASTDDIAGLAIWGELVCIGAHIAVYEHAMYMQVEINRSTPPALPEQQHGWEKPPSITNEVTQLRLYVKQKLAAAGYGDIEVITVW